jgi:site-specific DNA recombinase
MMHLFQQKGCIMKRAAIGLRVSSEKQAEEGFSLPSQFRRNTEFATTQGFEVSEEHIFREVFTGTKGDRPELNKIRPDSVYTRSSMMMP